MLLGPSISQASQHVSDARREELDVPRIDHRVPGKVSPIRAGSSTCAPFRLVAPSGGGLWLACAMFSGVNESPVLPRVDVKISCPCCASRERPALVETIPQRAIWEALDSEWGIRLSPSVARRHSPGEEVRLLECPACGLRFFDPLQGGDPDFYRELGENPGYYSSWKWEFTWAKERLSRTMSVLDVGCGNGIFLSGVRSSVRQARGVDPSAAAVAAAAARGLDVATADPMEFARSHREEFDAVCAFHVVEHLAAPVPFLRSLVAALRPGGYLILSIPNRERSARKPLESLDCPPHHLTRWGSAQVRKLATILDVRLEELAFEPVDISVPRNAVREAVNRAASTIPGVGEFLGRWAGRAATHLLFPDFLRAVYRHTGTFERMGFFGLSMAVRYVRTGS